MWCDHFQIAQKIFELIMECLRLLWVSELKFCLYQKEKKKWVEWLGYAEDFLNRQCLKRFTARPLLRAEMGPAKDLSWRKCACDDAARHILQMINYHWSLFFFLNQKRNLGHMELHNVGLNCMDFSQLLEHIELSCASLTSLLSRALVCVFFYVFECIAMSKRILAFWSVLINTFLLSN